MDAASKPREGKGLSLLAAHCASLDLDAPSARERLEEAVGPELAHKLVFALCAGGRQFVA